MNLPGVNLWLSILNHLKNLFAWVPKAIHLTPKSEDAYVIEELNKKVYINKNGDGLIVCAFDFSINKPAEVSNFERELDIQDAKVDVEMPAFKQFKNTSGKSFFSDYMFKYKSDDDIIRDVLDVTPPAQKATHRVVRIKMNVDTGRLVAGKKYRVIYGYSIPGLFPISNGKFSEPDAPFAPYTFSSSLELDKMSKMIHFAIYFEEGIGVKMAPLCRLYEKNRLLKQTICVRRDNLMYTKYLVEVDSPPQTDRIELEWNIDGNNKNT